MNYVTREVRTWLRDQRARSAKIANLIANSKRACRDERRISGQPRKKKKGKGRGEKPTARGSHRKPSGPAFHGLLFEFELGSSCIFFFDHPFLEPLLSCSGPQKHFGEQASCRRRGDEMRHAFYPQPLLQMELITEASLVSW